MLDMWLWPMALDVFYWVRLVWIDGQNGAFYRHSEQDLPQYHERSLRQREGQDRFRNGRDTAPPVAETESPPGTGVLTAAAISGTTSGLTASRLGDSGSDQHGGNLASLNATVAASGGREEFHGSSTVSSAAGSGQEVEVAPAPSVSVARAAISSLLPAQ